MKYIFIGLILCCIVPSYSQTTKGFTFQDKPDKKEVDILYNGHLLTAYCYYDSVMKPVLFPINTLSGITVTRGFPVAPRPGERVDHPHHVGLWMNYESVNGLDFWNNSPAIPYDKRSQYGTIYHDRFVKRNATAKQATLDVSAQWKRHDGMPLLAETTHYAFSVQDSSFIIDRTTTLYAVSEDVSMKDVKDGFIGMRVTRELELPSKESVTYVDDKGIETKVAAINNDGVAGDYISSEGKKGGDVWGTRGQWVTLFGTKNGTPISVTIIDHKLNPGYPTYWHARGYGLFAANPLGQAVFSNGKETLNLVIKKGESKTFRYRVVIHEGTPLTTEQTNALAKAFGKVN